MGRYYSGDIEGKFWFGVQSSTDADFFGGEAYEPNEVNYFFTADQLPEIRKGVEECKAKLGDYKAKLDAFFAEGGPGWEGYNFKKLADYLEREYKGETSWDDPDMQDLLKWYSRLELGEKILDCVEDRGECNFTVEL